MCAGDGLVRRPGAVGVRGHVDGAPVRAGPGLDEAEVGLVAVRGGADAGRRAALGHVVALRPRLGDVVEAEAEHLAAVPGRRRRAGAARRR